jgi:CheY-like chemotaxis protein
MLSPLLVLLVEDNDDHAELVMRNFEKLDFPCHIKHVRDGEAALDYLFRRGVYAGLAGTPFPSLILLDLRLPRIDGLSVLKEIKAAEDLQVIPIVILTSSESDSDIHSAYQNHVNSFLVKPLDGACFSRLMQELGLYWLQRNISPGIQGTRTAP